MFNDYYGCRMMFKKGIIINYCLIVFWFCVHVMNVLFIFVFWFVVLGVRGEFLCCEKLPARFAVITNRQN
jgi:hypothetical protein